MNYEPNAIQWQKGAIVIHDADAKEPKMLMRVTGFSKKGLALCRYVDKDKKPTIYPNRLEVLLAPERFGLNGEWGNQGQHALVKYQRAFERVRRWNYHYKPGQLVETTSEDGGFQTVTASKAFQNRHNGDAYVRLEQGGLWLLKFVKACK